MQNELEAKIKVIQREVTQLVEFLRTGTSHHHSSRHLTVDQERKELDSTWPGHDPYVLAKKLITVHKSLAAQVNQQLAACSHPDWLTQGRIMKGKGTTSANYQPITFLPKTWKVLSGIIATKLKEHIGQYMSTAQKDVGNNTRSSKHQLLIDRAVAEN